MKDKYNNFVIKLNKEETEKLFENINRAFPNLNKDIFNKICEYVEDIDKSINGRFGGSIKDLVAVAASRYVTTEKFINSNINNLVHVEIGTLFGGTAILTDKILKINKRNKEFKNIMIDPLCGYYDNPTDFISGLEVNATGLISNLEKFDVSNYKLIQKYSTDEDAIRYIKNYSVASIFIDGDHSFAGLLKDWNNYSSSVILGGHIIIDNINDKNWPNINIFIELLKSNLDNKWKIKYEGNITIILEKISNNNLLINRNFDIEIIHKIERQVDEKFYTKIQQYDNRIKTKDEWILKQKEVVLKLNARIETKDEWIAKQKEVVLKLNEEIEIKEELIAKQKEELEKIYNLKEHGFMIKLQKIKNKLFFK